MINITKSMFIASLPLLWICSHYNGNRSVGQVNKVEQFKYHQYSKGHDLLTDTTLVKAGDMAPDIAFRDTTGFDGKDMKLSNLKGKYVLIDVWASWCSPCRAQQPHLAVLEEQMKDKAITFVSISIDTQPWRWKGPLLEKMGGLQWMVRNTDFEKAYGINTIPRFILLDKKGKILNLNMPMPSHPELAQELNKLEGI